MQNQRAAGDGVDAGIARGLGDEFDWDLIVPVAPHVGSQLHAIVRRDDDGDTYQVVCYRKEVLSVIDGRAHTYYYADVTGIYNPVTNQFAPDRGPFISDDGRVRTHHYFADAGVMNDRNRRVGAHEVQRMVDGEMQRLVEGATSLVPLADYLRDFFAVLPQILAPADLQL
jgi:hypothetical protein